MELKRVKTKVVMLPAEKASIGNIFMNNSLLFIGNPATVNAINRSTNLIKPQHLYFIDESAEIKEEIGLFIPDSYVAGWTLVNDFKELYFKKK